MYGIDKQTFSLTYDNFRAVAAQIEKTLRQYKLSEHEVMNGRLMLEELFVRLRNVQEDFHCNIEVRRRLEKISSAALGKTPLT